jgi:hypothetical protein
MRLRQFSSFLSGPIPHAFKQSLSLVFDFQMKPAYWGGIQAVPPAAG